MFDYIHCERELPSLPEELIWAWGGADKIAFQTKDIENSLSSFKITANGELMVRDVETVIISEGDPNAESIGDRLPKVERVFKGWNEVKHNGAIHFYESYSYEEKTDINGWVEYKADFMNGVLQGEIQLIEHTPPRNYTQTELDHYANKRQHVTDTYLIKIEDTKSYIKALTETQDFIYKSLLKEFPQHKRDEIEEWLWDYIFNDSDFSLQKLKELL